MAGSSYSEPQTHMIKLGGVGAGVAIQITHLTKVEIFPEARFENTVLISGYVRLISVSGIS